MPESVTENIPLVGAEGWEGVRNQRLQLAARRHGCQVRLCECTPELRDLVAFMGLADVLAE